MNLSPTEIVGLFTFVAVTLTQYATVAGHGVAATSAKTKPKNISKLEVAVEEPPEAKKGGKGGGKGKRSKSEARQGQMLSLYPCTLYICVEKSPNAKSPALLLKDPLCKF